MNGKIIASEKLKVVYTDNGEKIYDFDSHKCACDGFDFEVADGEICKPLLSAKSDVKLEAIEIVFEFDKDFADKDFLYFNNTDCTNGNVAISSLEETPGAKIGDVTVMKNTRTGDLFGFGRVTGRRFFTSVYINQNTLILHFEMEGKALKPGAEYFMEEYIIGYEDTNKFLERYAQTVAKENNACPTQMTPVGFCSWSCWFSDVTEAKIVNTADELMIHESKFANLVQIDDGWQRSGSFCGKWVSNDERFPKGMAYTADYVHSKGMKFGLWLAPLLLDGNSEYYDELKHMARTDEITLGDTVHPFDFDNPEFYTHLYNTFKKMVNEYKADYFKIDFILTAMKHFTANPVREAVRYESDYSIALLRKALQTIRDAVGDDVLLLSCGAPIVECAGIFNLQRTSCDIIWGKNPDFPQYWDIVKHSSSSVLHRWFYNRVVFTNDPDGIVVRDIDKGDGFNCTYSEAQYWSAVAMLSGGSQLHNEELSNLSPGRRSLIVDALPPINATARPVDFFENYPTSAIADLPDGRKLLAIFNLDDKLQNITFELSKIGAKKALAVDYYTKESKEVTDTIKVELMNAHGVAMYYLQIIE